jgi:hypothetical protein
MLAQSLAVRPNEAATQWALDLERQERNREAWNLPRAVRTRASGTHRDGLNWAEFKERYYPRSRRHNFEAIVAYGEYRSTLRSQSATPRNHVISEAAESLGGWEDEGGATSPDRSRASRER